MKIRELTGIKEMSNQQTVEKPAVELHSRKSFNDELVDVDKENYRQYFSDLTDKINHQAEVLINKTDIRELQKYRMLISEFMTQAVKFSYKYDREASYDARGRQRVYANIKKVDNNLDELARAIINDQQQNIDIMGIVDDIRGLIVDMFM